MNKVLFGDNLAILKQLESESVDLVYIDPPFNTGKVQSLQTVESIQDESGSLGFGGKRYTQNKKMIQSYADTYYDYLGFLMPRIVELYRILKPKGSFYCHLDYREVHRVRLELDHLFGPDNLLNEIIWAYDYGAKPKTRWPAKHDNILFYVKDTSDYVFNVDDIEREPYMAPGLVTPEKAARGKLPTDVWWHTIVPTNGSERTGYPTQKPEGILRRIISASSNPGDAVLDCFAGSGTTGVVAAKLGREFILIDQNPQAIEVIQKRLEGIEYEYL